RTSGTQSRSGRTHLASDRRLQCSTGCLGCGAGSLIRRLRPRLATENRQTAVIVHEVDAELGVQRLEHIAEGKTPLTIILRRDILAAANQNTLAIGTSSEAVRRDKACCRRA